MIVKGYMDYTAVVILTIIIVLISYTYYISHNVVEDFLFMDDQRTKLPVNANMLNYSILLPDNANKQKYTDQITKSLDISQDQMLKNLIKYNNDLFSEWITTIGTQEASICQAVAHYVKKKYSKVLFCKLNKYKYNKTSDAVVMDIDFVFDKGLHCKTVCLVEIAGMSVQFLSIKAVGTISEDKLWQTEDTLLDQGLEASDGIAEDINLSTLLYTDNCQSMQTQDQQLHNLLYSKLMHMPDKASLDNLQYMENQNKVRHMFMDKLNGRRHRKMNNCYKSYPYKDDFVIVA